MSLSLPSSHRGRLKPVIFQQNLNRYPIGESKQLTDLLKSIETINNHITKHKECQATIWLKPIKITSFLNAPAQNG
jgi:hypothetical protein